MDFWEKYKKGLAKEGVDFFTCGAYDFCKECQEIGSEPCNKVEPERMEVNEEDQRTDIC